MTTRLWILLGLALGILLAVGLVLGARWLQRRGWLDEEFELGWEVGWPFPPLTRLLTPDQRLLCRHLEAAFPDLRVLPQVGLRYGQGLLGGWAGRRSVVVDFLLCEPEFIPLAVIELDDGRRHRPRDRRRAARQAKRLSRTGLPLVRIAPRSLPGLDAEELRRRVALPWRPAT